MTSRSTAADVNKRSDRINSLGVTAGRCRTADGLDYWDDVEGRHAQHRRHIRNLSIAMAAIAVMAVVVDIELIGVSMILLPFLLLEVWMARRTRTER